MKYVLDTTAYSELKRGCEDIATAMSGATEILVPEVVVAELLY